VRGYFDGTHHVIHTASNGREALDWLASNRADLALMDIRMPVMDGRSALTELRRREGMELFPVIAVTASSLAREEGNLRKTFDGYVRKPFSRAQLFAELCHFIPRIETPVRQERETSEPPLAAQAAWSGLVQHLRQLQHTDFMKVREGMVLSEVTAFATQLKVLAGDFACSPLSTLAGRMLADAEGFALDALEKDLAAFPNLVDQLEASLPSPSA
jgi:CheY-like chemotaxis protein